MARTHRSIAAAALLGITAAACADNVRRITPSEPMTIRFSVEPGVMPLPDTLVVHLGAAIAGAPGTGARTARLVARNLLPGGTHATDIQGDVTGPLDLDPGITFRTPDSIYAVLNPGIVDLTGLYDGTPGAEIRFQIETGTLDVDLDDVRIEWGSATAPDAIDSAPIQPVIYEIFVGRCPCYADFDCNGRLDLLDWLAFLNAFERLEFRADCDGCGEVTIFDFLCFQDRFLAGCP
ncbi:MAG: hypothetical protein AAFX79_09440 [Planctomycetota bacterium]